VSSASERKRRYRARKRAGLRMMQIVVDDVAISSKLVDEKLLHPVNGESWEAITIATERLIAAWIRGEG